MDAFRFEKKDDSLWLVRPNLTYRWDKDDPLSIASERSFPEAILSSFKIEQQHPDKKLYLLNVTRLFTGDVFRLSEIVGMVLGGPYMLDVEKTAPEKIKGFPDNSIVDMRLHYYSARGAQENPLLALLGIGGNTLEDSRSAPIRVTYNMWFRKDTGYQPRLADPRVGYFTQDFYSVSKFFNEDRTQKYIYRFDLKKKDPTAAMSEPVKPIVWVIDPSIPPQYRDAVKEGVLRWNRAYEAIGFKNAVQVIDAPNDPDYDHADGRYNVVRWTMSPDAGYAIAWTRNDPFTGETLNASVTFDANMLAYSMDEHQRVATPAAGVAKRSMDVLYRNPERKLNDDQYLWSTDKEMAIQQVRDGMAKAGWHAHECMYGTGLAESASFGWNALLAGGGIKISKETYAKQFISDVISHEVGHCLGLRHNFIGSTNLSTSELADDNCTNENGISASVMDYVPVNVMAVLKGSGNFYTPTVGPYDKWAIRYGYTDVKGGSPLGEKHELSRIASMSGQKGLAFLTDENADGWDPYAVRFDSAKDPIAYSGKMLAAAQRTRQYAITQLPKPGESYAKRTSLIIGSISQTFKQGRLAARFVGGIRSNRNFKADSGQRPTLAPVNAADQREAMRLITKHCLSAASFNLPADVLMNLSQDAENSPNWTAPLRDFIGNSQTMLVAQLMSAATTDRITENQFKWG
ncbi:MAG TPA: zinc-dependent metalloprotease, partial [Fimbriimonadaceae bacterium]|nr:zinc-dependent metalloprotease [Fimbriimonadaceae bacterium]